MQNYVVEQIPGKQYHVSNEPAMEGLPDNVVIKKDDDLYKVYDTEAITSVGKAVPVWGCSATSLAESIHRAKRIFGTNTNHDHNPNLNY